MTRTRDRALALGATALSGGGVWWFVRDPALAASVGVGILVGALLWVRVSHHDGDRFQDETWRDRQWVSLLTGVTALIAFNGTLLLPISLEYRIGVQALVATAALIGYAAGTLTEIVRDANDRENREADGAVPADD
jgi:hypothetical protein